MKKIVLFSFLIFASFSLIAQDLTQGLWYNEKKSAKVQFYKQGDKMYGKIVWLKDPLLNGKPKVDKSNPEAALTTKPLLGDITALAEPDWILSNFKSCNADAGMLNNPPPSPI
jgi:hypothetical protein